MVNCLPLASLKRMRDPGQNGRHQLGYVGGVAVALAAGLVMAMNLIALIAAKAPKWPAKWR